MSIFSKNIKFDTKTKSTCINAISLFQGNSLRGLVQIFQTRAGHPCSELLFYYLYEIEWLKTITKSCIKMASGHCCSKVTKILISDKRERSLPLVEGV